MMFDPIEWELVSRPSSGPTRQVWKVTFGEVNAVIKYQYDVGVWTGFVMKGNNFVILHDNDLNRAITYAERFLREFPENNE